MTNTIAGGRLRFAARKKEAAAERSLGTTMRNARAQPCSILLFVLEMRPRSLLREFDLRR